MVSLLFFIIILRAPQKKQLPRTPLWLAARLSPQQQEPPVTICPANSPPGRKKRPRQQNPPGLFSIACPSKPKPACETAG